MKYDKGLKRIPMITFLFFFFFLRSPVPLKLFIYLFGCAGSSLLSAGLSLAAVSGGYSLVAVCGLLIAAASLVAEHRL